MKKFSMGLALGVALTTAIPVAHSMIVATPSFSDVKESDWYYEVVVDLVQRGYTSGYEDGTFKPNNPITRAEVGKLIVKADSHITSNKSKIYDLEKKVAVLEAKVDTLEFPGECFYDDQWYDEGDSVEKDSVCEEDVCGVGTCTCQADGTLGECEISY